MPCLIVVSGPMKATCLLLMTRSMSLGRGDDCAIQLVDEKASRNHCKISRQSGDTLDGSGIQANKWVLEDLGSSNGTTVNGQSVSSPIALEEGLMIGIGTTNAVFLRDTYETVEEAREHADNLGSSQAVETDDSWPLDPPWSRRHSQRAEPGDPGGDSPHVSLAGQALLM